MPFDSIAQVMRSRSLPQKMNLTDHQLWDERARSLNLRRSKKNSRSYIDNEFFKNGYNAVWPPSVLPVYMVLAKYANQKNQTCYPSITTIMQEAGIKNRNTAVRALRLLEEHSLIVIQHGKGGKGNHYALLDCSVWKRLST